MRDEGGDFAIPQIPGQLFDLTAGLAEHQTLLTGVQHGDDLGGVLQGADVVKSDIPGWPLRGCGDVWGDNCGRPAVDAGALQPGQKLLGVAHGRGEPDPLDRVPGESLKSFQNCEQVPPTVVAREGVDLVDNHTLDIREVFSRVDLGGDQHRLKGLRGREQDVRGVDPHPLPRGLAGVAVPELGSPS